MLLPRAQTGEKDNLKKKNLLQDLLLVFFWIPFTMLLLIPLFFMNYIIFKMSIPQNYTKHLAFRASQIHLLPQLPPLRQAAECPSSAKAKEWAKQNTAKVPRRRNLPSALRKPRTGGCSMPRWDHAWRHGSGTGGAGSQAKAQSHFILKGNKRVSLWMGP